MLLKFIPQMMLNRPRRRSRKSPASKLPSAGPAGGVSVIGVFTVAGDPTRALWAFDPEEVGDPTESVGGFIAGGHAAIAWARESTNTFIFNHGAGAAIEDGVPWSNSAGAGGIVRSDGTGSLVAGEGTVG